MNDPSNIPNAWAAPIESLDDGHLKAIVICHYVWGGLILVLSCFFIFYIVMGMMVVKGNWPVSPAAVNRVPINIAPLTTTPINSGPGNPVQMTPGQMNLTQMSPGQMSPAPMNPVAMNQGFNAMPPQMGYVFVCMGSGMLLLGWLVGILTIFSGRAIARRKWRMFSLVMAGVNCASFPLGTLLGVFTFIVLLRGSVRALYPA